MIARGTLPSASIEALLQTPLPELHTLELGTIDWGPPGRIDDIACTRITNLSIGELEGLVFPTWIEELPSLKELTISDGCDLEEISEGISKLTALEELHILRSYSLLRLPEALGHLKQLRVLRLEFCPKVKVLPCSLWQLPALEELTITSRALGEVPANITQLDKLRLLDLTGCSELKGLPDLRVLTRLEELIFMDCRQWTVLPEWLGEMKSLRKLQYGHSELTNPFPAFLCELTNLVSLDISDGFHLDEIPDAISKLKALTNLRLEGCENVEFLPVSFGHLGSNLAKLTLTFPGVVDIPESLGNWTGLTALELEGIILTSLPESIGQLQNLQSLTIADTIPLAKLPSSFSQLSALKELKMLGCNRMEQLPAGFGNLQSLTGLTLRSFDSLVELPSSFGQLTELRKLGIYNCQNIATLPESISALLLLTDFKVAGCQTLGSLPEDIFTNYDKLTSLAIWSCPLTDLPPSLSSLASVKMLRLQGCSQLSKIPDCFDKLTKISVLQIYGCSNLKELPSSIGCLTALKKLFLNSCTKLKALPESLGQLTSLEHLKLSGCSSLEALPTDCSQLQRLKEIYLGKCHALQELPEWLTKLNGLEELWVDDAVMELNSNIVAQLRDNGVHVKEAYYDYSDLDEDE